MTATVSKYRSVESRWRRRYPLDVEQHRGADASMPLPVRTDLTVTCPRCLTHHRAVVLGVEMGCRHCGRALLPVESITE